MTISTGELIQAVNALDTVRKATPWYRPIQKFRLDVMISTLLGVVNYTQEAGNKRSCGCATHTNHQTN